MKYVLDSSVAVKWVLDEADDTIARQLRTDYQSGVHELLAPDVFAAEVGHALTRAERQGRITPGDALALWTEMMMDRPAFETSYSLTPRAIAISSAMRIGVYDCLYVALAEHEGCELVTADERLVRKLKPTFPFITSLASL